MEISPHYNPKDTEAKIVQTWLQATYFNAHIESAKKPFCVMIPPPNITGILHMGHALNNTIQDVLIRHKRMQGFSALWMPGTDHAGIATQNVVEKSLAKEGLRKEDIGREKFTEKLWQWRDQYGNTILQQLKSLGASCDWERTRFTMDEDYNEAVKEVFVSLYDKGLIYRGNYIINWCPRCKTALSDEEAAHKELDGWLYYIKYPVYLQSTAHGPQSIAQGAQTTDYIVVATTRPETMLGDTAVAINPKDERYQWLKSAKVILPIMERQLTVVEDEAVDPAFGTGVVKVTPSHDPVDFMLGKKHNLKFINIMHADATLNENAGEFSGMDRFEARQAVLELLEEKKLIDKKQPYKVSAGHCYRCHTVIEPRVSLQWFVRMKPLAEPAIKVVEEGKVTFYPERWKKVYLNWMNNIQDWCISRQIWWGHRLPVWYCQSCAPKTDANADDSTALRHQGVIVSKVKPEKCPECGGGELSQDPDVLDTWFSSWLWPFATFHWPFTTQSAPQRAVSEKELAYYYPTSVLVTASEILFFWVARMIMAGLEFKKDIPFKHVYIHGTVRDERGIKMSKSLGNVIDPLGVIDKFGADALRFSLMLLAASGSDVHLSDEKFLVGRNFSNKMWNATRFLFSKIESQRITIDNLQLDSLDNTDQWILEQLDLAIADVDASLANYRINDAAKKIYEFFWNMFCDWYIEIVKDSFTEAKAKVSLHVLLSCIKLLHPLMPFITEEIFGIIKANTKLALEESIVIAAWPRTSVAGVQKPDTAIVRELLSTIGEIRNIKTDLGIATKKIKLFLNTSDEHFSFWRKNDSWIKRLALLTAIEPGAHLTRTLFKNDRWSFDFDVEGVSIEVFISSLDKKVNQAQSFVDKISARLNNENFVKNAAVETVEQERSKFLEASQQLNRLKDLRHAFK